MPIKKAAIKALRQAETRTVRNLRRKRTIKTLTKHATKVAADKKSEAETKFKAAIKAVDKAVAKKAISANSGSRRKSRLMRQLNALKA
ncbi:MAG: 30S ribosomal protein S20 [Candidatus Buchananbacteria bacterium]|nr:30S ribosomal protein S20 [Candidatus Buchananbacteria bacterium]